VEQLPICLFPDEQPETHDDNKILDPFEVEDGWFEIQLPDLQLVITDSVPQAQRERAKYTLKRLRLTNDTNLIGQRMAYYGLCEFKRLTKRGIFSKIMVPKPNPGE